VILVPKKDFPQNLSGLLQEPSEGGDLVGSSAKPSGKRLDRGERICYYKSKIPIK